MSLYIDKKYASLLSNKLEKFKWQPGDKAQFRCPLCGDSSKSKLKTRGGFFPNIKDNFLMCGCFNCGYYAPFGAFLKQIDANLHKEYVLEKFKYENNHKWAKETTTQNTRNIIAKAPTVALNEPLTHLKKISQLDPFHPAAAYIRNRKIPFEFHDKLYYTDNYKKWINDYIEPNKFKYVDGKPDERIVIPFLNSAGTPFAYQGRFIGDPDSNTERYITCNPVPSNLLLFGVERLDAGKPVYVVEGPLDSLFVPNCVAVAGSALTKLLKYKKLDLIFCFDNEPHSATICKIMEKVIENDKKIVIWPKTVKQKDINDMVLAGKNVLDIVQKNCYNGLTSRLKFNEWKRI